MQNAQSRKFLPGAVSQKGFSLVELLVVIAVIGVIAAIAIPAMSGIFSKSRKGVINQNAQNLATVFAGARAAGATFDNYDKDTIIDALTSPAGVNGKGKMETVVFKLPMAPQDVADVKNSIDLVPQGTGEDFMLVYTGQAN